MSDMKTKATRASVDSFLASVPEEARRADCTKLLKLMAKVTREEPRMWGPSMVGFGSYHYKYESGREGDWFLTGFSPRKDSLSIYIVSGLHNHGPLLEKLGKFKTGKSCLYVKKLADVDLAVLGDLVAESVKRVGKGAP